MSETPRTDSIEHEDEFREHAEKLELELNAITEERDELREEVKSLKETILDQENHIMELQARRPFAPGYTAEP